ncbi:MAG: insulinase family protein [Deltaproteobacteria bacterium]|nr:insulinase family protein [Deltaproteobacteria bacterium]
MSRTAKFLSMLALSAAVAAPGAAFAKKKKRKKKAEPEPATVVEETPPSMWKHESTEPLLGDLKVERYTLTTNDLTLLLVVDPASPTFSYHTYFDVGSGDERDGITGIAHLFEHMMFKKTDGYEDGHFSQVLEESGTPDLNAWTWLDITAYHASLPKEKLALLAELEATRMDGLVIDEAQLNSEREVVINERRYRVDDDPEGLIDEQLWALAFEKTNYHWSTIGWRKDLDAISVEDCNTFYADYYAPNNATLVLVGDLDRDATLALLEEQYKDIEKSDLNRRPHGDEPEQTEPRRKDMEVTAETELFTLGTKVPAISHEDTPALMMVDAILSGGNSSRLERKLVDGGWASSFSVWLPPFQHEALFTVGGTMREGKAADAAIAIVRNEFADLRDNPVTQLELDRARNQLLSYLWNQLEGNSGLAGFLGFNEISAGSWTTGLERIEALRSVTAEDVQRVAQTYLLDNQSSAVVGRPKGKKLLTFSSKKLPKAGAGELLALPGVLGRPDEGMPPYMAGQVQERETGGWTRLMVYDPRVPKVWFRMVLPFGAAVEGADELGITNVTAELLLRGTADRSRQVFEATLEGLGASLSATVGADDVTIAGSVLSENWPKVATLLAESIQYPAFSEDDLADLIDEVKADIVEARNNDRYIGYSFYEKGLFAGHPYAQPVLGTTKTLGNIDIAAVKDHYRKWFSSQGAVLALLGNFDAGAGSDLARIAGKLEANTPERELAELPAAPEGRNVHLIAKPERSQLQMHFGHYTLLPNDPDYPLLWLGNEAFGGHGFGARMMKEIREKNGYSYGAYGSFVHEEQASTYTMWIFPAKEQAEAALTLMLSLYDDFAASGLTAEELTYARGSILNSAAFYVDTPRKRLGYEVTKRTRGLDPLSQLPAIEAATLEQVNAAVAASFTPGNIFGTVVAPKDFLPVLEKVVGEDTVKVLPYDKE